MARKKKNIAATPSDGLEYIAEGLRGLALKIDTLTPDPDNTVTHDAKSVQAIKRSLERFGQDQPLVVQEEGLIVRKGNGRLAAAMELGWTHIAAVVVAEDNLAAVARSIADNRSGEFRTWDYTKLATLVGELKTAGVDTEVVGWNEQQLSDIMSNSGGDEGAELPPDVVPEPPADPITKPGDLIVMAGHRLLCGDCRDSNDMATLMSGAVVNVAITSPPYASQRKYDETTEFKPIHPDEYVDWFNAVQAIVSSHLADDGSWFVNIKEHCEEGQRILYVKDLTLTHVRQWGWWFVDEYAWTHGGTPKAVVNRFKNGWEPIFHFTRGRGHKFRPESVMHATDNACDWTGGHPCNEWSHGHGQGRRTFEGVRQWADKKGRDIDLKYGEDNQVQGSPAPTYVSSDGMAYPSNVLSLGKNREALGHSAAYPVSLPEFFIRACTDKADIAFDPFMGSGSTMIAAEHLGRKCYGMEISPAYCDVIVERWEKLTGEKATREKTKSK